MGYMTDRKRASGMGSAKTGTARHWSMTISSVALLFLVPAFIFTFGSILGSSHDEVIAYYAQPFPAIVAGLTIAVAFMHFKNGVQTMLEDYVHGLAREILIIAMICISYAAAATGLFALARIAL
jgi:succinate dehydrogenase / fumarate reductase, membrane anchor subunit